MAILLDGKKVAEEIREDLKGRISKLGFEPRLAIISALEDEPSKLYIEKKKKFGESIGARVDVFEKYESNEENLLSLIELLNSDETYNGIIVQLPLPQNMDKELILDRVAPTKDVDGLSRVQINKLYKKEQSILPATVRGIDMLLKKYEIESSSANIVVISDSILVGRPAAMHFLNKGATVTICHENTSDLSFYTRQADIVISATGVPHLLSEKDFNDSAIVIDVGTTFVDGKLTGDINFEKVEPSVRAITPVPGGVGPMTVASLFLNLVEQAEK